VLLLSPDHYHFLIACRCSEGFGVLLLHLCCVQLKQPTS
jgi:hypothetical protein